MARGENHGKALVSHNIVRVVRRVGAWRAGAVVIELPDIALPADQGYAVLVQDDALGPVLGAALCPDAPAS